MSFYLHPVNWQKDRGVSRSRSEGQRITETFIEDQKFKDSLTSVMDEAQPDCNYAFSGPHPTPVRIEVS